MFKTGKSRRLRRNKNVLAEVESNDNSLISRMNREQEEEARVYASWISGK